MNPTIFIHTNGKQMAGAIVSAHSLKRNSQRPNDFDVRITAQEDFRLLHTIRRAQISASRRMAYVAE